MVLFFKAGVSRLCNFNFFRYQTMLSYELRLLWFHRNLYVWSTTFLLLYGQVRHFGVLLIIFERNSWLSLLVRESGRVLLQCDHFRSRWINYFVLSGILNDHTVLLRCWFFKIKLWSSRDRRLQRLQGFHWRFC